MVGTIGIPQAQFLLDKIAGGLVAEIKALAIGHFISRVQQCGKPAGGGGGAQFVCRVAQASRQFNAYIQCVFLWLPVPEEMLGTCQCQTAARGILQIGLGKEALGKGQAQRHKGENAHHRCQSRQGC